MASQNLEIRVIDKTGRALGDISKRLNNLNKGLLGINRVAGLAAGALASIGGGITLRRIVRVSAEFQDLRTTLTSVTGSAQEGAKAFEFLTGFATQTQFSTQQLTTAFVKLKTAGIDPTTELLTTFTDAAAVTTDQIGTLQAITDLFARTTAGGLGLEEINRLTDRGLPALDILQEKLGLNRQAISDFGKTAEGARIITEALAEGIRERFGGATAARLNNLSVQFSNLNIAIDNAADKVGRGGLNAALGDLTKRITETITKNDELATELGQKLAGATIILGDALTFAVKNLDILGMAALAFIGLKVGLAVTSLALAFGSTLFKGIGFAIKAFGALRVAAGSTKIALATLLGPISLIAFGLAELAVQSDVVKKALGGNEEALDDVKDGLEDNTSWAQKATNALKEYTGIDLPGYLESVATRQAALTQNQKEMNQAQDEFNQKKAEGSIIDEDEVARLKQKPKTYAEILVAQEKLTQQSRIALEQDKLSQALLRAELELGRQLTDIERERLQIQIQQQLANEQQLAAKAKLALAANDLADATLQGLQTEMQFLERAKEEALKVLQERLDLQLITQGDYYAALRRLDDEYNIKKEEMAKAVADRITAYNLRKAKEEVRGQIAGLNEQLSAETKVFLQQQGNAQRLEEAVNSRIEFEKKSEAEKYQFLGQQASSFFGDLAKVNKKFARAAKAAAIVEATINTYVGATKALASYPPPFNFIAAAAVVASGLAQVATIRAQTAQRGGTVIGGQTAVVGEDGPELIVPKQSSTVIPREVADAVNNLGGGRQEPVQVVFQIQANDTSGFDQLLTQRRGLIVNLINTALNERGKAGITS